MNVDDRRDLFFLDTNVLLYGFSDAEPWKQRLSEDLVARALASGRGMISAQVVQEFLNVVLRKLVVPMKVEDAQAYLRSALSPLWKHQPSIEFYDLGLQIRNETGFSFYDSLIVAAAIESGCQTLLTEDLQHGRTIRGLRIVNPFIQ